jgi:tRNA-specific 2-thiouridylase
LPEFLQQQLEIKHGNVIEIEDTKDQFNAYHALDRNPENIELLSDPFQFAPDMGIPVAEHIGAHYYTIGQRKGLHIGGRPNPSFVIGIDTDTNIVYTGQKEDHPGLNRWALKIQPDEIHWINPTQELAVGESMHYDVRIRYRQALQPALLIRKASGLYILFETIQRGITPGQFAAWYKNEELVGSGIIAH